MHRAPLLALLGCCSCGGVSFADVVDGHVFGAAGEGFGLTAQLLLDFTDADVVTLTAEARDGDTITDSADASCDRGDVEETPFEAKLATSNCAFNFVITSRDDELPETPSELLIGFRNAAEDGSVEVDASLDEDLPFPFSFVDDYGRLERVD